MKLFKKRVEEAPAVDTSAASGEDMAADLDAVMRKYDRESNTRIWEGPLRWITGGLMAAFSLYCIAMTLWSTALPETRLSLFLACIVFIGFLTYPIKKGHVKVNFMPWYDIVLMLVGAGCFLYFAFNAMTLIKLATRIEPIHVVIGAVGILILLELCRRTSDHTASVRAGEWKDTWCYWKTTPVCLRGRTLGVIGFGSIGRRVGELGHAFGMSVLANCRTPRNPPSYSPFAFASTDQIFQQADVISLHCPLTDATRAIINANALARMKPGAILINTARGPLLDEAAVAEALHSGKLGGLGVDVLAKEPPAVDNPLLHTPNTLITPHMAWATARSRQNIINLTAENILRWQQGTPVNVVNGVKD